MGSNTKVMEEALQAAVSRMNNPDGARSGGGGGGTDPLGVVAAVLPKLLENRGEREDIAEQLEGMRNEELAPMRDQIKVIRARIHHLAKSQDTVLAALEQLREQQTAIGDAVLSLARQLARIEILDEPEPEVEPAINVPRRAPAASAPAPRATSHATKAPRGNRKNARHEQS
jgi:hypothetical protein